MQVKQVGVVGVVGELRFFVIFGKALFTALLDIFVKIRLCGFCHVHGETVGAVPCDLAEMGLGRGQQLSERAVWPFEFLLLPHPFSLRGRDAGSAAHHEIGDEEKKAADHQHRRQIALVNLDDPSAKNDRGGENQNARNGDQPRKNRPAVLYVGELYGGHQPEENRADDGDDPERAELVRALLRFLLLLLFF